MVRGIAGSFMSLLTKEKVDVLFESIKDFNTEL